MHLAQLWRHPVKSLRGEPLAAVEVGELGFPYDRAFRVADARGELVTARTQPGLLALRGDAAGDGGVRVEGYPVGSANAAAAIAGAAGEGAQVVASPEGVARFDDTPLLLTTDGAIAALGFDGRRLRPNLVIGGVEGLAEREWEGRRLRIGVEVELALEHLCERCVITTIDPDTLEQDPGVLRTINERFGKRFAINAGVLHGGRIALGDPVELI